MVTINQYRELIVNYYKNHKQINTVLTDTDFNFNAEQNIIYPVVNTQFVTQSINATTIQHQFEIVIADLFDPNVTESEIDIYNDCNMIALDFIDWLSNQINEEYEINESVSIQKFTDGNVDRVAGCVFVLTFNQFREANACIAPISNNIGDTVTKIYYGVRNTLPSFDELSSLSGSVMNEIILNTGLNNSFVLALQDGYVIDSINDLDASNLSLISVYNSSGSVTNGDLKYNLYYMEQVLNYSTNHRHKVVIKMN